MLPLPNGKRKPGLRDLTSLSRHYYSEIACKNKLNAENAGKMKTNAQKVVSEAMELPPALRAFVAEKSIESLDAPAGPRLCAKWRRELRRRCAEVDRGAAVSDAKIVLVRAVRSLG